jgi:hypothetical protein
MDTGDDRMMPTLTSQDRELLSCLEGALSADDAPAATADIRTTLRAARLLEEVRGQGVAAASEDILRQLAAVGVLPVVVGGCAFAERIHGGWARRHCGGLELIVRPDELDLVRTTLDATTTPWGLRAVHGTGFVIHVDDRLFRTGRGRPAASWQPERVTIQCRIAGHAVRLLDEEWALVHALGSTGLHLSPATWWAVDAGLLILRRPALDWARVATIAQRNGVQLPVLARLVWLRDRAGVPVPDRVLDALRHTAYGRAVRMLLAPRRHLHNSRVIRAARSIAVASRSHT